MYTVVEGEDSDQSDYTHTYRWALADLGACNLQILQQLLYGRQI